MKKWFITLIFVFACLPVVAIKAAPPQTYAHLDYEIINGYYDIGDGVFTAISAWRCSNQIQIPRQVDKLYFSNWSTHFILFFTSKYALIGFYHEEEFAHDLTWSYDWEDFKLGDYSYSNDLIHALDVPTNATYIVLQTCPYLDLADMEDYMQPMPIDFSEKVKPIIYYPAPTDAATNMTFGLMPALMIMIVIAGLVGSLIMITKKSKR